MDILKCLSKTTKGRLSYDRTWFQDSEIEKVLEECSTSPKISVPSPKRIVPPRRDSKSTTPQGQERRGSQSQDSSLNTSLYDSLWESRRQSQERRGSQSQDSSLNTSLYESLRESRRQSQSFVSPKVTPVDTLLSDLETSMEENVQNNLEKRRSLYEGHSKMLLQQVESQLMELSLRREKEAQQIVDKVRIQEQQGNEEVEKRKMKMKEHYKQHAMNLDARLQEAHRKQREEEQKQAQREQESLEKIRQMRQKKDELRTHIISLGKDLASCEQQYLTDSAKNSTVLLTQIMEKIGRVIEEASQNEAEKSHVTLVEELMANAKQVFDLVNSQIVEAKKKTSETKAAADRQKKGEEERRQKEAQAKKAAAEAKAKSPYSLAEIYTTSQDLLEKVQKSYEPLLDATMKKYKFDLQKAVNIPINTISRVSGSHLQDKLRKLTTLLSRQPVDLDGGSKRVSIATHQAAYPFCKDLMAKKIMGQGMEQVASNHDSAFPIAAVVVGICHEFLDVMDILLAHFYRVCPYLLPHYLPKLESQSTEDYLRALGYKYENGEVEKQEKFLKRMSGLARLYGSIMVSNPPPQPGARFGHAQAATNQNHPFPIQNAWIWLVHVLNQDPRPDVTATLLYDVMVVTGHLLLRNYGKQFLKLVQTLSQDYLPKIKALNCQGGPVARLERFIDKVLQTSKVEPPEGMIPASFWNT